MTSFNGEGIAYDTIGNPLSYKGNTLTWTMGRQLATYGANTYTYNEDGIRTSKTVNGVTTKFYLNGTDIIEQTDGTNTLHFFYDSTGEIIGFEHSGNNYFYIKNSMDDIVAIADSTGTVVTEYTYSPWGEILSVTGSNVTLGELNPFRYRSYYYDSDIEMYYLQSRYYDPEICRFINSDDVNYIGVTESEISYNPFSYCENNAVNDSDPGGSISIEKTVKVLNRILESATNVAKFLIDKFGMSRKRYMSISKYKKPKAIYSFVYNNKKSLKNFKNNGRDIAKFINIVLDIVELSSVIKGDTSCLRAVAEIVFFGFIKLLTYAIPKLVAWLITTICKTLKLIKSVIEDIISYILEDLLESKGYKDLIRRTYLNYVDKQAKLSFKVFIYGLFYGVKKCFV